VLHKRESARDLELGNLGEYRWIEGRMFELKFQFDNGYRIYIGEIDNKLLLLLIGGNKSSQKKDIKKAKRYWQNFIES